MKITIEEAKKIALLSRLEFSPEDLEKMRESMNSILTASMIRQMLRQRYMQWNSITLCVKINHINPSQMNRHL